MRFAVPQIARRRTNQFRNLVRVLKFRAVHFDNCAWIAEQYFRAGFHDARLAGPGWSQEQQIAHRPPRRIQSRAEHLIQIHQRLHTLFLADNLRAQRRLEFQGVGTALLRIERKNFVVHDRLLASRCCSSDTAPKTPSSRTELFQFDLDRGLQKPQLHKQLFRHCG